MRPPKPDFMQRVQQALAENAREHTPEEQAAAAHHLARVHASPKPQPQPELPLPVPTSRAA